MTDEDTQKFLEMLEVRLNAQAQKTYGKSFFSELNSPIRQAFCMDRVLDKLMDDYYFWARNKRKET